MIIWTLQAVKWWPIGKYIFGSSVILHSSLRRSVSPGMCGRARGGCGRAQRGGSRVSEFLFCSAPRGAIKVLSTCACVHPKPVQSDPRACLWLAAEKRALSPPTARYTPCSLSLFLALSLGSWQLRTASTEEATCGATWRPGSTASTRDPSPLTGRCSSGPSLLWDCFKWPPAWRSYYTWRDICRR